MPPRHCGLAARSEVKRSSSATVKRTLRPMWTGVSSPLQVNRYTALRLIASIRAACSTVSKRGGSSSLTVGVRSDVLIGSPSSSYHPRHHPAHHPSRRIVTRECAPSGACAARTCDLHCFSAGSHAVQRTQRRSDGSTITVGHLRAALTGTPEVTGPTRVGGGGGGDQCSRPSVQFGAVAPGRGVEEQSAQYRPRRRCHSPNVLSSR